MRSTDLVLEGGGVKAAGLAGAVAGLAEEYTFHRVAGTSAGAIVGSFVAAGLGHRLEQLMLDVDVAAFADRGPSGRWLGRLGRGLDLVRHEGIYRGEALHRWITDVLAGAGVRTWGDLRIDHDRHTPVQHRYGLVVIVSDISRGRMLRLPWDYEALGLDPDRIPVADAVRASASIPFVFRPVRLPVDPRRAGGREELFLTDGGMLSNFPISIFDDDHARPTVGVRLSAPPGPEDGGSWTHPDDPVSLARALVRTLCQAHDRLHIDLPSALSRTIFVDTHEARTTDLGITDETKARLFDNGLRAAAEFMCARDDEAWRALAAGFGQTAA